MQFDKFISLIYRRPELWDRNNKNAHNRNEIENTWQSISKELGEPASDLKKKWKYLRDQFRQECSKIPIADITSDDFDCYSSWPYFKELAFLKNHIKFLRFPHNDVMKHSREMTIEENSSIYSAFDEPLEDSTDPLSHVPNKKRRSTRIREAKVISIQKQNDRTHSEKDTSIAHINCNNDRDEDAAFFESLLPHMRKLEGADKFRCRMEIQNIVCKYAYGGDLHNQQEKKPEKFNRATKYLEQCKSPSEVEVETAEAESDMFEVEDGSSEVIEYLVEYIDEY